LSNRTDRRELADGLRVRAVEFVIIDPLYLCLLRGASGASAANIYEIGPLLYDVATDCLDAGATPLLVHHATKWAGIGTDQPLGLDELAFTGIGEFARQWVLVSRRGQYTPGSGEHDLTLAVGGSAGHSGCWRLRVSEGRPGPDLSGRRWDVGVSAPDCGEPVAPGPASPASPAPGTRPRRARTVTAGAPETRL
jgi:hypothetical protein